MTKGRAIKMPTSASSLNLNEPKPRRANRKLGRRPGLFAIRLDRRNLPAPTISDGGKILDFAESVIDGAEFDSDSLDRGSHVCSEAVVAAPCDEPDAVNAIVD